MEITCFNGESLHLVDFGQIAGKLLEITFTIYEATETPKPRINILSVHVLED
jgi:hypothetical protein